MAYKELPEGSLEQYETASTLRYDGTKDYGYVNAGKNLGTWTRCIGQGTDARRW